MPRHAPPAPPPKVRKPLQGFTGKERRPLKLNSVAPLVLSARRPRWGAGPPAEVLDTLKALWRGHEALGALAVTQQGPQGVKCAVGHGPRGYALSTAGEDDCHALATAHLAARLRRSGGARVPTFLVRMERYTRIREGDHLPLYGDVLLHLHEIRKRLEMEFLVNKRFTEALEEVPDRVHKRHDFMTRMRNLLTWSIARGLTAVSPVTLDGPYAHQMPFEMITSTARVARAFVAVPLAPPLPARSLPLRAFSLSAWLALVATAGAFALAWRALAGEPLGANMAAAPRAVSSRGGSPLDRVRALTQRLQLAAALLAAGVVVAGTYQGRLVSLMIEPEHYPETDTIEQLVASGMSIFDVGNVFFGIKNYTGHFYEKDLAVQKALAEIKLESLVLRDLPKIISERQPYAIVLTNFDWHSLEHGKILMHPIHVLKEFSQTTLQFWPAKLNWPWIDAVNKLTLHLDAGGIRDLWASRFEKQLASYYRFLSKDNETKVNLNESAALVLKDVTPHFSVLSVGLLVAMGVFIAEISCSNRKTPTTHTKPSSRLTSRHTRLHLPSIS